MEVNVIMRGNQDCGLEMCTDCHHLVLADDCGGGRLANLDGFAPL